MSKTKSVRRIVKRTTRTNKRGFVRRSRFLGPEIRQNLRFTDSSTVKTGTQTSDYGWVYGMRWNFNCSHLFDLLPSHARELKVLRSRYTITAYSLPTDDQITPGTKTAGNDYWPSSYTMPSFDNKFFAAILQEDTDIDTGDTTKFKTVNDVRFAALPGKFKYGTQNSFLRFSGTWTPQEPSEREWIGRAARGHATNLFRIVCLTSHLTSTGWVTPESKARIRNVNFDISLQSDVIYRGHITTQSVSAASNRINSPISSPSGDFQMLTVDDRCIGSGYTEPC